MPSHEFAIRNVDGLWEVRLDGHLRSGQPTQMAALHHARALAHTAAVRGRQSKILVFDDDGGSIEFPATEHAADPA